MTDNLFSKYANSTFQRQIINKNSKLNFEKYFVKIIKYNYHKVKFISELMYIFYNLQ